MVMQLESSKLLFIAGPCLIESHDVVFQVARQLAELQRTYPIQLVLKGSYRKANRTSAGSFQGIGDLEAIQILKSVGAEFGLPTITDVHTADEASWAADFVDVLQIPAFLSRQTALLEAAAETGKTVNIKKAQFMAAEDVIKAANKCVAAGNDKIWLTERGTSFGYHDLVVDFRGVADMVASGFPVIFDATHSVQRPSIGVQSGGSPQYIPVLSRAAAAVGVRGIFAETHPNPLVAMSDAETQLPLHTVEAYLQDILKHYSFPD
ncbi:MAG: 3-deoxy-8-phosphooctulonate synthase [Ignavibacteria bacterium]|nr:3-deoxy-8-phosphooctulonate synthase [Ignavibacteria bacterium]